MKTVINISLLIISIFCFKFILEQEKEIQVIKIPHYITVKSIDTVILYKDTSDSHFFKCLLETENGIITKAKKYPNRLHYPIIGDGGLGYGAFGMHESYVKGSGLPQVLGYKHEDMFDLEKASHVFWAKTGINCYRFKQKYGRYPTWTEIAMMHNGSIHSWEKCIRYKTKFEENDKLHYE